MLENINRRSRIGAASAVLKLLTSIAILSIVGCNAVEPETLASPSDSVTVEPESNTPSPTKKSQAATPSGTPIPQPNESQIPSQTPTTIPSPRLVTHCYEIRPGTLEPGHFSGWLLIDSPGGDDFLLDLHSQAKNDLISAADAIVSPNRELIAYKDLNRDSLIIADADLNEIVTLPAESIQLNIDYDILEDWLDDQQIIITRRGYDPQAEPYVPAQLVILDPFSGDQVIFTTENFPKIRDVYDQFSDWSTFSRLSPNPALTRMVYPALEGLDAPIILWDLVNQREIARVNKWGLIYGGMPEWSPDGQSFVISAPIRNTGEIEDAELFDNLPGEPYQGGHELLLMNGDGQLRRLTYITSAYAAYASAPAWSPDGTYIAYWLRLLGNDQDPVERLVIVDVESGFATDTCIRGFKDVRSSSGYPVWSPDGKFLAVSVPDAIVDHQENAIILDIKNFISYDVMHNADITGWLKGEE